MPTCRHTLAAELVARRILRPPQPSADSRLVAPTCYSQSQPAISNHVRQYGIKGPHTSPDMLDHDPARRLTIKNNLNYINIAQPTSGRRGSASSHRRAPASPSAGGGFQPARSLH